MILYISQGPTNDGRIKPDLVAPSAVQSTTYASSIFDGPSVATPYVAGAAALLLQAFPGSTPDEIADLLRNRAVKLEEQPQQ